MKLNWLRHPLVVAVVGTGLFALAGVCLTNYYQTRLWQREKTHEIFMRRLSEGVALIDELSEFISNRFFGLNRVFNVMKVSDLEGIEEVWKEYYQSFIEWNTRAFYFKGRMKRSIGIECAESFLNNQNAIESYQGGEANTLHGHFLKAHMSALKLRDCIRISELRSLLDKLGFAIEDFLNICTAAVYRSAESQTLYKSFFGSSDT